MHTSVPLGSTLSGRVPEAGAAQPALPALPALKEWGAVVLALLDGRQTLLLRKGGIHEKRFVVDRDRFVLFPTVAHSHAERVRPEHRDVVERGAAEVDEQHGTFIVRCGVTLVDVVEVACPERLDDLADLHIWTPESVRTDRLDFRPRVALRALVVRAIALPRPVRLERLDSYGGCRSWVDLPVEWDEREGRQTHAEERLAEDAARVRAAVG